MNRIVREHYPVAELPEDLREGLDAVTAVRVTIESEPSAPVIREVMTLEEMFTALPRRYRTMEEIVAGVRSLRDEWDD